MAEEIKQDENKPQGNKVLPMLFKVILGLCFLALGTGVIIAWWSDLLVLVRGSIGLFLILAGVITLAIAKE